MLPLRSLFLLLPAVLLLCGGCLHVSSSSRLTLEEAQRRAEKHVLELRTLEYVKNTGSELVTNRRLLELPEIIGRFPQLPQPELPAQDIRLRLLEEAMDTVAIQRLPAGRDPVAFYRPFAARRLRCETASLIAEFLMYSALPSSGENDRKLAGVRMELALALGETSRTLPEFDASSLPVPGQKKFSLPELPGELRESFGADPAAPLRYAEFLFRLPVELRRRELLEPDFDSAGFVAAALYYGAAYRKQIASEYLIRAEAVCLHAKAGRERHLFDPHYSENELRALCRWRQAYFRWEYDQHCAPPGRGSPAIRFFLLSHGKGK